MAQGTGECFKPVLMQGICPIPLLGEFSPPASIHLFLERAAPAFKASNAAKISCSHWLFSLAAAACIAYTFGVLTHKTQA